MIPLVQKFHSPKSPWEIYQALERDSEVSFFLDSSRYSPPNQVFSYLGANPFLEVRLDERSGQILGRKKKTFLPKDLFPVLRRLFRNYAYAPSAKKFPFFTGGALGYWGYELASLFEKIKFCKVRPLELPRLYLGFYRDLIVYDHQKKVYWLVTHIDRLQKKSLAKAQARANFSRLEKYFESPTPPAGKARVRGKFHLKKFKPGITRERFEKMVRKAKSYIAAGDIYQANLSQRFDFDFKGSAVELYGHLRTINPSPFASFLKIRDLQIVSNSPERLVRKTGKLCETQPIAGTRPRKSPHQSEKALEKELQAHPKERAEHIMLVDLERNDLGRVCRWPTVRVKSFMQVEKYSHVMHLVSTVQGELKPNCDAFDLIQAMFPGGTITGCPKIRCMEIIEELEPVARGMYTGSIGYIDFRQDMDLNIVIRTLVLHRNKGYLQVGAGIVYDSDPRKEYEETLHKGEALVEALARVSK